MTAWSRERPRKEGWYWWRATASANPKPLYVDYGLVNGKTVWYAEGHPGYLHDWTGEWQGPLEPKE